MNTARLVQAVAHAERQNIGARVKAARLDAGLGRLRTARAMRAAGFETWIVNTLVRIEVGDRRLQSVEAVALAEILCCDPASLQARDV